MLDPLLLLAAAVVMILQSASSLDLQLFSMCCHTSQKRYTIKDRRRCTHSIQTVYAGDFLEFASDSTIDIRQKD